MLTSRRQFVSAVGLGSVLLPTIVRSSTLPATPEEMMGPFYPVSRPLDQDADLTMVAGKNGRAAGEVIELTGRVLYVDGTPAKGAVLDLWQANAVGRYDHPMDDSAPPLDPNFQSSAKLAADADGQWRVVTILPGAYGIGDGRYRTRHIHWDIHGAYGRLVTQSYFPGETLNEADILLGPMLARGASVDPVMAKAAGKRADGIARYSWDIILPRPV